MLILPVAGSPFVPNAALFSMPLAPVGAIPGFDSESFVPTPRSSATDFITQMQSLRTMAMRQRLLQDAQAEAPGQGLPNSPGQLTDPRLASDADFFSQIRQLKQQALQANGGQKPDGDKKGQQDKSGTLHVDAHSYTANGKKVPVQSIRTHKIGDWNKRSYDHFSAGFDNVSGEMDNAKVGDDYRVVVTWENGQQRTQDVHLNSPSQTIEIYQP